MNLKYTEGAYTRATTGSLRMRALLALAAVLAAHPASAESMVSWGASSGDPGIVSSNQAMAGHVNGIALNPGLLANPPVGATYYPDAEGRTPWFTAAAYSPEGAMSAQVRSSSASSDSLNIFGASGTVNGYSLVLWKGEGNGTEYGFLNPSGGLPNDRLATSDAFRIRVYLPNADANTIRFVLKQDGVYYASEGIVADTSPWDTTGLDDPRSVAWYVFDPETDIRAIDSEIDAIDALGDFSGIEAVGYWMHIVREGASGPDARVSWFEARMAQPPRPLGIMLTWTGDPSTTMTVDWHVAGEDSGQNELQYRQYGAASWETATAGVTDYPHSDRKVLRAYLMDLLPESTYEFRLGDFPRTYSFRTMPETLDCALTFAVGGDTRHQQEWMERTNRVAMEYDPEFVVWGGDLAYADGLPERLYRWYEFFDAIYNTLISEDGRVVPVICSIGNHEMLREVGGNYYFNFDNYEPGDAWRAEHAPYFFSLFAFPGQPGYGVVDFGDYLSLVIADSAHANPMDGAQLVWLETVLQERTHVPHVFPVYHVPGYTSARNYNGRVSKDVRELWSPLFEQYGVKVAFENHDHTYKRTPPIKQEAISEDGVVYLGDGAWGVSTREVHPPEDTWYLERAESIRHAIIVTLEDGIRRFLVVSEDGVVFDTFEVPAAD